MYSSPTNIGIADWDVNETHWDTQFKALNLRLIEVSQVDLVRFLTLCVKKGLVAVDLQKSSRTTGTSDRFRWSYWSSLGKKATNPNWKELHKLKIYEIDLIKKKSFKSLKSYENLLKFSKDSLDKINLFEHTTADHESQSMTLGCYEWLRFSFWWREDAERPQRKTNSKADQSSIQGKCGLCKGPWEDRS